MRTPGISIYVRQKFFGGDGKNKKRKKAYSETNRDTSTRDNKNTIKNGGELGRNSFGNETTKTGEEKKIENVDTKSEKGANQDARYISRNKEEGRRRLKDR